MGLSSLNKRPGNSGGGSPSEKVIFQVKEYVIADPKNASDDDYIVAYLMRDSLGITAAFDKDNNPTTEVKIKIRPARDDDKSKSRRPPVLEFKTGKAPLAKPMGPFSIGKADGCYFDQKTGFITTTWLSRVYPNYDTELNWPMVGVMASVRPESGLKEGENPYQNRIVAMVNDAVQFEGIDGFRQAAVAAMDSLRESAPGAGDDYPGTPGIFLRGVHTDEGVRAAVEVFARWNKDDKVLETSSEAIERFLASDTGKEWIEVIEVDAKSKPTVLEVIPALRVNTGKASLPSEQKKNAATNGKTIDARNESRYDDSIAYRLGKKTEENPFPTAAFAISDLFVQRTKSAETGELSRWISTGTEPVSSFPLVFPQADLITKNLPAPMVELFTSEARERNRRPEAEPAPEAESKPYGM